MEGYNPAESAGAVSVTMAPGEAAEPNAGGGQRQSSLSASTAVGDGPGPLIGWVRSSPYSMGEVNAVLNAVSVVLFVALLYMEVSQ
jgi:hypothetical protein